MIPIHGTVITIGTSDGPVDAYLARPAGGSSRPAVLLFSDAFGLRPPVKSMADRIAAETERIVLVPNLLYRHGQAPVVPLPHVIDDRTRAAVWRTLRPVLRSLTPDLAMRDAGKYLAWLESSPDVLAGPVALVGYCIGARLALLTAGTYPQRVAKVAGFHGGRLATDDVDSPHLVAPQITAELYFAHADKDPSLPLEQVRRLENALTAAGVRHLSEVYWGAHHGFTQADTDAYDTKADARHWAALFRLLKG
ncbi:dienelactone hydrolase family protein [Streptomyces canus]|uniref:dienelactone hydrolase family protein n=1 Tax=Streptomyces canus TaxID=58343 RepID=UPI0033E63331